VSDSPPKAWAERLYDETGASLLLYGRAFGLGRSEAEDVLHDCFAALLGLEGPPANPRHYLVRAFRNRALNHRRSWWRRVAREIEGRRWFEAPDAEDPRELLAMRLLPGLPAAQREVIVLKIWHKLTFQTIGELLDISPHTAAGRFRYGMERLRRAIEANEHEPSRSADPTSGWLETEPPLTQS
jgi:RNA polymerase sigma-70 factor (ECF subfamily)